MTIRNAFEHYVKSLASIYDKAEAESIARLLFEERIGLDSAAIITRGDETMSEVKANDLAWKLIRLMKGEPVQYVLGYCHWFGLKLKVNKHVLIPRPETEELVEWVIQEEGKKTSQKHRGIEKRRILDIGTGSGCIAIALKKNLQDTDVTAVDISEDALTVAWGNAAECGASVYFIMGDIVNPHFSDGDSSFDIIVSNPPYIPESEKSTLHANVIGYEPNEALFAPDQDPLIYYKAIIHYATRHLINGGRLYFEIHPVFAEQLILLLTTAQFNNVELKCDLSGKPRMVRAIR
jgi:release factor glutamine methyltransferase